MLKHIIKNKPPPERLSMLIEESRLPSYDTQNIPLLFSNMWTMNFLMCKLVLEKAEESEIKLPTSAGSSKKQESSRRTSISALLTTPKPLTVWIIINCGKFWKRWEYQTTWPALWVVLHNPKYICTQYIIRNSQNQKTSTFSFHSVSWLRDKVP